MVRLRLHFLLIIKLFSVILFSMLCSNTGAQNLSNVTRHCIAYTRCSRSENIVSSSSSILEGNSIMINGQNLTSIGGNFTVGFFVRGNNMYLGTWYTSSSSPEKVIVWVANRDKPIPSRLCHNCSLFLEPDGKAVVLDSNNQSYWSTENSTTSKPSFPYLEILDNGNLKLLDRGGRGGVLWQSFDEPTDTFLLGMNLISLTSWKSDDDPAQGNYLFQNKKGMTTPVLLMYNLSHTSNPETLYWDSRLSSLPPGLTALLTNNMTEDLRLLRLVMNSTGSIQLWKLDQKGGNWSIIWMAPQDQCDFIDTCGIHGVSDSYNGFRCKCLPGYNPNNPDKWESKDFSGGCSKKTKGQCGEVFLSLPMIKLPNQQDITPLTSTNETECRKQCVFNCECEAYSFDANQSSCLIWKYDLTHIQEEYYNVNANTLYIRLNRSDTDSRSRTCGVCGTNVIPYPLSTNRSCGDLAYFSFECNNTNGQLYFKPSPPNGKHYKVSVILPEQRKFTVQLVAPSVLSSKCDSANNIEAKQLNLNTSSPFKVTNCSIVTLIETTPQSPLIEVELTWNPPSQPLCNSTADCKDWLDTNCGWDKDGKKVCLCTKGSHWNSLFANCTRAQKTMPLLLKVGIACGTVIFLLSCISFVICLRRRQLTHTPAGTVDQFKMDDIEHDIDIPFVDYQSIVAATDNFSDTNKLGAGGFGPVYKGMLGDGNEVAIKRLSAASTQGVLEFRNEIVLIAKLQHRNLVRVVGYCIQEDEKILIYEYMPNKSLDSFLFDQSMSTTLDWIKRFDIIMGIARGLVYLHQDSRLRIIHRDLKPSNILLDEELNPKISDFGLAKIIAGKEIATSTARVIGTYGYMSPEYALEGYFSVKSDVYSFGIIVFEVISGKRCTSLLQGDNNLISLLGYAWALWKEGKEFELVDESIADTWNSIEVRRCINVALLCVQEDPSDRPTMSSVLLMLGGDNMNLPDPKQPVFVARRQPSTSTSSSKLGSTANVEFTTNVEGR